MFIYIDESGSFVSSPTLDSWNVVAAYACPEGTRKHAEHALRQLKISAGRLHTDEIKLKDVTEEQFKSFLSELAKLNSTLFITGTDLGSLKLTDLTEHQRIQVEKIRINIPRMIHPEGRAMVEDLAKRVERLSPQLYTQMFAQIVLLDQVYRSTTLYYAQRVPSTLGSFRWRIDEKNSSRPLFEETMRHMAPPLLQAMSLSKPAIFATDFDYSHYEREFRYKPGEMPTYLQEETGVKINSGSNLGKVLKDFKFVRSHDLAGVQIADLLASGFRRALRNGFADSIGVAGLLGKLTVQRAKHEPPIHLVSLAATDQYASGHAYEIAQAAKLSARPMLV